MNDSLTDLNHPRKLAGAQLGADLPRGDATFNRVGWQAAADAGTLGITVPTHLGGEGASVTDALLTFEGLGLGCLDLGLVFGLSAQVFSMQSALLSAGSDDQLSAWVPRLISGSSIGAFAMSEPDAGSNTAAIETVATPSDAGYRLDGRKTWVTLGPEADVVIVFATIDPDRGRWGLTAFLVPTDTPGLTMGPAIPKLGLESCPFSELEFDGCEVPTSARLGPEGAGGSIFSSAVNAERAFLYAAQLGAMERVLNQAIDRARNRTQFDRRIGEFQAVSHRIADMKLRHETARLLVYKAGLLHDRGEDVTMAAALAKLQTSELSVTSVIDAIQIHGAAGFTQEVGLGEDLTAAIGGLSYSGTSDIQRNIVAGLLGADRPPRPPLSEETSP